MSQPFALYNGLKNWTLSNLTETEVCLLLMTFSENELKLAKLSRKGDSKWESVLAPRYSFLVDPRHRNVYSDMQGFPEPEATESGAPNDKSYFQATKPKTIHPRLHDRLDKIVTCVIANSPDKNFVTHTVDLSEGGLHFKDQIPDWVAGYFVVIVDDRFQLLCSLVEDQKEKKRVQIVAEENDPQYELYKEWIKN